MQRFFHPDRLRSPPNKFAHELVDSLRAVTCAHRPVRIFFSIVWGRVGHIKEHYSTGLERGTEIFFFFGVMKRLHTGEASGHSPWPDSEGPDPDHDESGPPAYWPQGVGEDGLINIALIVTYIDAWDMFRRFTPTEDLWVPLQNLIQDNPTESVEVFVKRLGMYRSFFNPDMPVHLHGIEIVFRLLMISDKMVIVNEMFNDLNSDSDVSAFVFGLYLQSHLDKAPKFAFYTGKYLINLAQRVIHEVETVTARLDRTTYRLLDVLSAETECVNKMSVLKRVKALLKACETWIAKGCEEKDNNEQ